MSQFFCNQQVIKWDELVSGLATSDEQRDKKEKKRERKREKKKELHETDDDGAFISVHQLNWFISQMPAPSEAVIG